MSVPQNFEFQPEFSLQTPLTHEQYAPVERYTSPSPIKSMKKKTNFPLIPFIVVLAVVYYYYYYCDKFDVKLVYLIAFLALVYCSGNLFEGFARRPVLNIEREIPIQGAPRADGKF